MTPEAHDDLVSRSSHLPHVVAAELANYVLSPAHPKEQALVCANGFRDTTRIAAGSPEMWRDIALANRKNLGRVLGVFIEDLQEFQWPWNARMSSHRGVFRQGQTAPRSMARPFDGHLAGMKRDCPASFMPCCPRSLKLCLGGRPVSAQITVPGSKSITNRALILAALANGDQSPLRGALWSEDTQIMVGALRQLGFDVEVRRMKGVLQSHHSHPRLGRAQNSQRRHGRETAGACLSATRARRRDFWRRWFAWAGAFIACTARPHAPASAGRPVRPCASWVIASNSANDHCRRNIHGAGPRPAAAALILGKLAIRLRPSALRRRRPDGRWNWRENRRKKRRTSP
jgi:hypothetical protein